MGSKRSNESVRRNIYVDIDGTLTVESEGWGEKAYSTRTPKLSVIRMVNDLAKKEHITIFTARYEEDREVTVRWLKKHGIQYHALVFNKPQYDLLIDDKALNPMDIL